MFKSPSRRHPASGRFCRRNVLKRTHVPSARTIVAEDMGVGVIVRQIDRHVVDNAIFSFRTVIEDDGLLGPYFYYGEPTRMG